MIHETLASITLVLLTLVVQCAGVATLIKWLRRVTAKEIHRGSFWEAAVLVMQTTIAVILLHGMVIFLWAVFFRCLCFRSWESAIYFSGSSYATVGYGDVLLSQQWRLLGPLESMIGVLMCGVSVGLLFALVTRLVGSDAPAVAQPSATNWTANENPGLLREVAATSNQ